MRTIKEWNKIIENYFNENNIEHDRNYLLNPSILQLIALSVIIPFN